MALDVPPQPALWLPPKPAIITRASADDLALIRSARKEQRRASFPFPVFLPGSKPPVTGGYRNAYSDLNNGLTTYTLSSVDIGSAAANRYIVIGVSRNLVATAGKATAVNLNGTISCTKLVDDHGSSTTAISLWVTSAAVTSGATATVNVTFGDISGHCGIWVYAFYGIDPASYVTSYSASGSSPSLSLNTLAGGCAVGMVFNYGFGTPTTSWTGLTENYDAVVESPTAVSMASLLTTVAESPRTISASLSSTDDATKCRACAVSFGPA